METLQLPIEVKDMFSTEMKRLSSMLKQTGQETRGFSNELAQNNSVVDTAVQGFNQLAKSFADDALNAGANIFKTISAEIGSINSLLSDSQNWINAFSSGLQLLGTNASSIFNSISSGISQLQSGFMALSTMNPLSLFSGASSIWSGISSIGSSLFGRGGLFGGDSDESMLKKAAGELKQIFGSAFDQDVLNQFKATIMSIPRAGSGGLDVLAATWHPDTIAQVFDNIGTFTMDLQKQWVHNLREHVKPVLMTTLGFSESEAANAMGPLFREILSKIKPGSEIDASLQSMINWAKRFGVELNHSFEVAKDSQNSASTSTSNRGGAKSPLDLGWKDVLTARNNSGRIERRYENPGQDPMTTLKREMAEQKALFQQMNSNTDRIAKNSEKTSRVEVNLDGTKLIDVLLGNGGDVIISGAIEKARKYKGA